MNVHKWITFSQSSTRAATAGTPSHSYAVCTVTDAPAVVSLSHAASLGPSVRARLLGTLTATRSETVGQKYQKLTDVARHKKNSAVEKGNARRSEIQRPCWSVMIGRWYAHSQVPSQARAAAQALMPPTAYHKPKCTRFTVYQMS